MQDALAQIINGIAMGSIYALMVLGVNLLLQSTGVMHFAFAHTVVLSMYAGWLAIGMSDGSVGFGFFAALLGGVILIVASEPLFRPLMRRGSQTETIIVGLGLGMIVTDLLSHFLNNGIAISLPASLANVTLGAGNVRVSAGDTVALGVTILGVVGLSWVLRRTKYGKALRAVSLDPWSSRILGIPVTRIQVFGFGLAGVIAGVIAVSLWLSLGSASSGLGDTLAIKAFILILVAGPEIWAGLVAALGFGILEALAASYLPGQWTNAVVFGVLMVGILVRPQGIFSQQSRRKDRATPAAGR